MRAIDIIRTAILLMPAILRDSVLANSVTPTSETRTSAPLQRGCDDGCGGCLRGSKATAGSMTVILRPPSSPNPPSMAQPTPAPPAIHLELRASHVRNKKRSPQNDENLNSREPDSPEPVVAPGPIIPDEAPPLITPAPGSVQAEVAMQEGAGTYTGVDANGSPIRFIQTTYYSCVTRGTYSHCGWHRPILEVSGAGRVGAGGKGWEVVAARAVVIAGIVGVVLLRR